MKLLFTSIGSIGHLHPSMPYAFAARAAGHEVAFAVPPVATAVVSALGFPAFAIGPDRTGFEAIRLAGINAEDLPIEEQNLLFTRHWILGEHLTERVHDLVDLSSRWKPDLIVRGEIEFGGCLAAERLGLPHASIKAYAQVDLREIPRAQPIIVERLEELRDQVDLPPDPAVAMPYRYLEIWPFPASFRSRRYPAPTCRAARPVAFDRSGPETLPGWIDDLPPRDQKPRVYVTLGTSGVAFKGGDVFERLLAGLRHEDLSLIFTVGRRIDPAHFGPQPANVHLEQYIPQSLLFPHCDLVVCHGGSGTLLSALENGLPLLIIPIGADQPDNARSATAAGYAVAISPRELTLDSIRSAVGTLLTDPTYRANARWVQQEIQAMPGPEVVVGWFERLARERVPSDRWS